MNNLERQSLFVTGATGFLGSHLVQKLVSMGHKVGVLIRETSNMKRLSMVKNQLQIYTDLERAFVEMDHIDAVIHCATNYGRQNESPKAVFDVNTSFAMNLLHLSREAKIDSFINTDTVLDPNINSYTLSKNQFKEWGKYLSNEWGMRFINFRFEHFYGACDDPSKFTSHVVQACLSGQKRLALTYGEQQRDFIYIDDAIAAYIVVLNHMNNMPMGYSEYDVGSNQVVNVRQFVEMVRRFTNSDIQLDFGVLPYRVNEKMLSYAETKALRDLGWSCQYSLERGLLKMIKDTIEVTY